MTVVDILYGIDEFKDLYKEASDNIKLATIFWNTYNHNPNDLLRNQQYHELRERMFRLLRTCKKIDPTSYEKINKGHPYFFIGITSFRLGDYQTAISFFDSALSEELKIGDGELRQTQMFFLLMGERLDTAASQETLYAQALVTRCLGYYNNAVHRSGLTDELNIEDLRQVFILYVMQNKDDPGLRTLLTAFITFIVEWDFRNKHFDLGVKDGTSEPLFMHLFRGCVLFESLLNRNPFPMPKHNEQDGSLGKLIQYYQNKMGVNISPNFGLVNTLKELLIELTLRKEIIEDSVLISYWLRNALGHNLAWDVSIDQASYRKLYFSVATACLHVIDCLWRNPSLNIC